MPETPREIKFSYSKKQDNRITRGDEFLAALPLGFQVGKLRPG